MEDTGSFISKIKLKHFSVNTLFSKSKNSFSWKHFGQLIVENDGKRKYVLTDQVFCLPCLETAQDLIPDSPFVCAKIKKYSSNVSTGNLMRHLRDDHSLSEEKNPASSATNLKNFFRVSRPIKSSAGESSKTQNKWILARDLALWFCRSLMPFDSVSGEGLEDFLTKYNVIFKKEDLPTRTTISREGLTDVYDCMLQHIKQELHKMGANAAMTSDLWQDQYRRCNYITFTLHFIADDRNEMQSYTLATKLFEGKKTGEALSIYTQNIISSFGLEEKGLTLVTDSGANVRRISQLIPRLRSHLCLGHGLHNLVSVDGLKNTPQIRDLVIKCKKVVKALRYRLPEIEKEADKEQRRILSEIDNVHDCLEHDENYPLLDLEPCSEIVPHVPSEEDSECSNKNADLCNIHNTTVPTIKTATPTRWHSTLAMLESVSSIYNQGPINCLLAKYNLSELEFSESEWELIEDLCRFLAKFKKIVELLSTDTKPSINLSLVFRSEIKDACQILDSEKLIMLRMKRNMESMLDHRFPITKLTVAGALLDCRFCKLKVIDNYLESIQQTRVTFLANYVREVVPASELNYRDKSSHDSGDNYLLKLAQKHADLDVCDDSEHIEKECLKYLVSCDASDLSHGNLIQYWQEKNLLFHYFSNWLKAFCVCPLLVRQVSVCFQLLG